MKLQNGFFMVKPFNPNPYINPVIVDLSGAQKFEEDTIFLPGKYKVEVKAGAAGLANAGGLIIENIIINDSFIIRAYCGAARGGINPYNGPFKVNGYTYNAVPPTVNHIFGNAGSAGATVREWHPSSGNSLGNGVTVGSDFSGAGSCLHIMPVGGVFGTDYLFAFHTTGGVGGLLGVGGSGGAYGGGASGSSTSVAGEPVPATSNGGSTPYGKGGAGVRDNNGNAGTGIGPGYTNGLGAACWYNGSIWQDSSTDASTASVEDGYIRITYLGPVS